MKTIILLISLVLLCGTATATTIDDDQHYIIAVIVWDNVTGEQEAGIPVTFGGVHTLYTAIDGSVVYDIANLENIRHGDYVPVSCKYGTKLAPIIICTYQPAYNKTSRQREWGFVANWGTGITFNEPDELTAIEAFAALGFTAIAIGAGSYILRKKKNPNHKGATMTKRSDEK